MKKTFTLSRILSFSLTIFSFTSAFAQDGIEELIKSSPANATKLTEAYLRPLFKGFGVGMNSGWYNTGKAKNTLRFEFRASVSGAFVPTSDKTFNVSQLGLSNNIRVKSGTSPLSSSVAGSGQRAVLEIYDNNNFKIDEFTMPDGSKLNPIPAPQIQGTLGLPKGIDLTLRAIPKLDFGDFGQVSMIGGGARVEVLPLILGKKLTKVLPIDIAVAFGYTQLDYKLPIDVNPPSGTAPDASSAGKSLDNQYFSSTFKGTNTQIILSKKLLFFTPFISAGYQSSTTNANLKGNYPVKNGLATYTTFTDPVSINSKYVKGLSTDLGFQLNLAFLRVYTSYSFGEYQSANFGLGFGIGK